MCVNVRDMRLTRQMSRGGGPIEKQTGRYHRRAGLCSWRVQSLTGGSLYNKKRSTKQLQRDTPLY